MEVLWDRLLNLLSMRQGPLRMVWDHARLERRLGVVKHSPRRDGVGGIIGLGAAECVWSCILRRIDGQGGVVHGCSGSVSGALIGPR